MRFNYQLWSTDYEPKFGDIEAPDLASAAAKLAKRFPNADVREDDGNPGALLATLWNKEPTNV